ncbi:response regulator [Flavobacterium sp.]|uniref:response regulator n=1 Tax=Flavobacterium sp. TaxID=239 RepID=UPI0039E31689
MSKLRIFYLDDDKDDIELFLEATESFENVQVIVFTTGDTMIKNLHIVKKLPNAVFVDLNMPRKSGLETIKEIRVYDRYTDMPIVVLTTVGFNNIDKSREAGANYFVIKPTSLDKLQRSIRHVLDIDFKNFKPQTNEEFALMDIDAI